MLKPFLRGRDVKWWRAQFDGQYLIRIESSENKAHPWSSKTQTEAERIFAKAYPAIHSWFKEYRKELIERYDQGKFFWELRACAYWHEFEEPKIIVPAITDAVNYASDEQKFFSNDKTSIVIAPSLQYTLAIMNSQVSWWFTQQTFASKQGGFYEFKPMYFSQLPIPQPPEPQRELVGRIAEYVIWLNRLDVAGAQTPIVGYFEQLLNGLVYELFFEEELHAQRLTLFKYLSESKPPRLESISHDMKLGVLKETYERLADLNHPVRACLFSLPSLEVVRITEGVE